jgi:hypothetical protein
MFTILIMTGILCLAGYLVVFAMAQALGEHADNVQERRQRRRRHRRMG